MDKSLHAGQAIIDGIARDVESSAQDVEGESYSSEGATIESSAPPVEIEANPDPMRRRIFKPARRQGILARLLRKALKREELTPAELAEQAEKQSRREKEKLLRDESTLFKKRIITKFTDLGFCYKRVERGHDKVISRIRLSHVIMTPDALFFKIHPRTPAGVRLAELIQDEILTELSIACQHRVYGKSTPELGTWLMVERASGAMGIPNHVMLQDLSKRFPATADKLTIPMGITMNSKPVYRSMRNMPHLLLAGTTGGGKSNMLNVILVTLLARNKPEELNVLMIDLKGGLELTHYGGVPHLVDKIVLEDDDDEEDGRQIPGIITRPELVPPALKWVVKEAEKRMKVIAQAGYSDVIDYNHHRATSQKIPRLLIVFDELASIKLLDPKAGKTTEHLLADIGNRGRAVGVHLIVCTQYPNKDVLSSSIKAILNAKAAFACSTLPASMLILGNGEAKGLAPVGRYVYQSGAEQLICQAPYFPKGDRDTLIENIRQGKSDLSIGRDHDVTELEIMEYSLEKLNGGLPVRRLYEIFAERKLTREELEGWLQSWEGQRYRVQDAWYEVMPGEGGRPRMLKPLDQLGDAEPMEETPDIQDSGQRAPQTPNPTQIEVDEETIFTWALQFNKGALGIDRVFRQFREDGLTHDGLREWLKEIEGKKIKLGDYYYMIAPGTGSRPRQIIPIDDDVTMPEPEEENA